MEKTKTEEKVGGIILPMMPQEPTQLLPTSMLWYGPVKCGKTTKAAQLPNHLIIDVERKAGFVKCNYVQPVANIKPVSLFKWLYDVRKAILDADRPYDFVIIDTLTLIDEAAEWKGTWDYMNSNQGNAFNRTDGKNSPMLRPDHPDYESVHSIGEGYGYRYSRKVMTDFYDAFKDLGRICTIFICHLKDKYVKGKAGVEIMTTDISLTGKVKEIICRDVDAVGYVFFKDGDLNISFNGNANKLGGMRGAAHLQGYVGPCDFNKIFLLDQKKEEKPKKGPKKVLEEAVKGNIEENFIEQMIEEGDQEFIEQDSLH